MSTRGRGTKTSALAERMRPKIERLAFSTIIECALDPCYLLDAVREPDGTICDFLLVHINVMGEAQLGEARETVLGGKLCELYPFHREASSAQGVSLFDEYVRVHETGTPIRREIEVKDLPTGTRWYLQHVVPTSTGIAIMCRDVTRETITERLHAELEQRMLRAQSMESVGMVAGGVAHDFGNLLLALGGFSDLALKQLRDGDPVRAAASLEHVLEATRRATTLTRQLLVWSGRRAVSTSALDLNEVVERNVTLIRPLIPGAVRVRMEPSAEPVLVEGDEAQLAQVLLNLCLNARDAMPAGGTLTIRTLRARLEAGSEELNPGESPGEVARLVVSDTGEGMDESALTRIFEPFYTTKPAGKGTGFGLALVYSIVRRHRGTVRVRSTRGAGTTFTLDFPLGTARPQKRMAHDEAAQRGGSETILIVDDDTAVRVLLAAALERAGYKSLVASNGSEAIEVVRRAGKAIDLVILDVMMPGMPGTATYDALRALRPDLPVLFSTAHGDDVLLEDGHRAPELLRKPYDPATLLRAVRAVLDPR